MLFWGVRLIAIADVKKKEGLKEKDNSRREYLS